MTAFKTFVSLSDASVSKYSVPCATFILLCFRSSIALGRILSIFHSRSSLLRILFNSFFPGPLNAVISDIFVSFCLDSGF